MSPITAKVKGLRLSLPRPLPSAGTEVAPERLRPTTRTAAAVSVRRRIHAPVNESRPTGAGRQEKYAGALTRRWRADELSGSRHDDWVTTDRCGTVADI